MVRWHPPHIAGALYDGARVGLGHLLRPRLQRREGAQRHRQLALRRLGACAAAQAHRAERALQGLRKAVWWGRQGLSVLEVGDIPGLRHSRLCWLRNVKDC